MVGPNQLAAEALGARFILQKPHAAAISLNGKNATIFILFKREADYFKP